MLGSKTCVAVCEGSATAVAVMRTWGKGFGICAQPLLCPVIVSHALRGGGYGAGAA